MSKRLLGVLVLALTVALAVGSAPALAVEAEEGPEEPPPNVAEICRDESPSAQFCPQEYVEPSFFQWLSVPLLIVGVLMTAGVLFAYLLWQPRFAEERRAKRRR